VSEKSPGRLAHYKLTSTVMLWLQTSRPASGLMNLGGSLTRQTEQDFATSDLSAPYLVNIGRMVEEMENKMRSALNDIYFRCRAQTATILLNVALHEMSETFK